MFAVITNRGSQIGLCDVRSDAQHIADELNAQGLDVFAWVIDAPEGAEHEDMPGRGFIYG